jgi:hypothetical protein
VRWPTAGVFLLLGLGARLQLLLELLGQFPRALLALAALDLSGVNLGAVRFQKQSEHDKPQCS